MKLFIENLYQNGVGSQITGYYCDQPFIGTISRVRPTYGGGVNVYLDLEEPILICEDQRNSLVLDGEEIAQGGQNLTENLHVYFRELHLD
jgi:hypothetical protein